ncbi:tape measure protein [uncultured Cedecea sp.]|uniref:tape measure protein n=1 Tax=uncultured Cedecea sp. TaxID=988762 RepID=UPI0026069A63|nr:tape measure protein [uncultured Cedecea sp.]
MSEDVGSIYIEIELEVQRLLDGVDQVNRRLNSLPGAANNASSSFNRAERSAGTLNTGLSKLAATIGAVITASALKEMAGMVQKHQEFAERVRMATSSQSEFNEVQERLLKTANGTFRALSEAQELYITTADSLRSMGYTTSQAIDIQDSMSYAFVKNATSADKASTAIGAFSKAINTGKVGADQWETITSAIPSVINDIATASGKSSAQVRALGAAGKLTAKDLTEGLKQSLEANETAATGMANTLVDATVRMNTAITSLLVGFENNTGVLKTFTESLISAADSMLSFSEDSDGMKAATDAGVVALGIFASLMAGKLTSSLVGATTAQATNIKSTIQGVAATRLRAKEELAAATVTLRRANADKSAALSALNLATAEANVARGSAAEALAMDNVNRTRAIYIAASSQAALANNALAASQARVAATGLTMANTMTALKTITAPLGGPIGVIAAVAAGWYLYAQGQAEAKKESIAFADSLPDVIAKLKELNLEQARGKLADTSESIENQKEAIKGLESEIAGLNQKYQERITLAKQMGGGDETNNGHLKIASQLSRELAQKNRDLDSANSKLAKTQEGYRAIAVRVNEVIVDQMKAARDNALAIAEAEKNATFLGGAHALLAQRLGISTQALQAFNSESLKINWGGAEGEKLIKQAERRLELSKLEGEARARLQAVYDAEDAGVKDQLAINQLQEKYAAIERNTTAQKKSNAESNKSSKTVDDAAQSLARQQAQLDRLNTGYAEGSLELAKYDAVQALGANASAQQIAEAKATAAAIHEKTQAIKNLAQAEQAARFIAQELAAANSTRNPYTGDSADPAAQIAAEEQRKLEALNNYQKIGAVTAQQYEDAKTAIAKKAAMDRAQIAKEETQRQYDSMNMLLGGIGNGFSGLADIVANSAGESNAAYKALFAVSKGFAVAQAGLNLQLAISNAMASGPFPWNLANMAQVAAAGGQVISAIGGASYGGARYNGGPVNANSMYRVGEHGKPEIFKANNGSQYMIPGDNGRVISNKDIGGSGGVASLSQVMNLTINTTNGIDDATIKQLRKAWQTDTMLIIKDQQRSRGLLSRSK